VLSGGIDVVERFAGERDALFDQRPDFLRLRHGGDDATFHGRLIGLIFRTALGQKQRADQVFQHRLAMRRRSS